MRRHELKKEGVFLRLPPDLPRHITPPFHFLSCLPCSQDPFGGDGWVRMYFRMEGDDANNEEETNTYPNLRCSADGTVLQVVTGYTQHSKARFRTTEVPAMNSRRTEQGPLVPADLPWKRHAAIAHPYYRSWFMSSVLMSSVLS